MARDSMVFYRSFYEAVSELDPEDFKEALIAILGYAMDDIYPTVSGTSKAMFLLAKPQIDANNKRYQNGCKGGRSETKTEPKQNQNLTKVEPNVNDNENENVNDKDNKKSVRKRFTPPLLENVMGYCQEYCESKGYEVDYSLESEKFIDFYSSKNWKVGKDTMVDWKSSLRNWIRRDAESKSNKPVKSNNKIHNYNERTYNYDELMSVAKGGY